MIICSGDFVQQRYVEAGPEYCVLVLDLEDWEPVCVSCGQCQSIIVRIWLVSVLCLGICVCIIDLSLLPRRLLGCSSWGRCAWAPEWLDETVDRLDVV